ncbi:MAG: BadF/BadG/BcrA/BcrD ATPase family protein [Armatimonadota bacterium]|nr:BadF/BadG/BcrA/BcrD ATPase family protein [Armatimonadota bacterium]MDR7427441.1 BadF/BadG/BcrA/BcrD ATPase family protein [Armatimonadota bacterium]MDR7468940.1 BadF/BadG/BcrA/BcrD ATPase family protein [Armatimonadota bacterium]
MPAVYVGVDVGSASVNVAGADAERNLVGRPVYARIAAYSSPVDALKAAFTEYRRTLPAGWEIAASGTTGSGRELTRHILRAQLTRSEIFAQAVGLLTILDRGLLGWPPPVPGTIIEIGGQDAKVIVLAGGVPIFFNMNSICAAGTGEFLQQLADEIGLPVTEIGSIALQAKYPARIDATCTVFSRRDFRHLTQKGVPLPDRLMGICQALAANYVRNVVGTAELRPPFFFQGGVAGNVGVRAALEARLGYPVIVPPHHAVLGAIGMAATVATEVVGAGHQSFDDAFLEKTFESCIRFCNGCHNTCEITEALERTPAGASRVLDRLGGRCERSQDPRNLHDRPPPLRPLTLPMRMEAPGVASFDIFALRPRVRQARGLYFAGIDGGSRGTKYAVIRCDADRLDVLGVGVLETGGDAVGAVKAAVEGISRFLPAGATLAGVGTTGSAGELARDMVSAAAGDCADYLSTEILAHFAWAARLYPAVGTVMDLGGNDAKIIVRRGGALEFAMNDKCAAGTGAFIEAVAKRFSVPIEEYGALACRAAHPARIAGRCAVFGESDIVHKSRLGYPTPDLLMGLALAICRTYLSDVGRGKELSLPVVAQGGAFLNDAVLAAFRQVLGLGEEQFIRHPDPRFVIGAGALGAALLARARYEEGLTTAFKGFSAVATRRYETVSLECRHPECPRRCTGVVALLEEGVPIAGYRSIDCPLGMFEGRITSRRVEAHMRALLSRRVSKDGDQDATGRHPAGPHLPLSVLPHP